MCPTYSDCARPVPKKLFVEQINYRRPPPPPRRRQKNFGQYFRGPKIFRDLQNFSDHQTPFPHITKLTTKLI
jgi:hypothetical protein